MDCCERTIDGDQDLVVEALTVNGSAVFNGSVTLGGTIDLDNITCTSVTASGGVTASSVSSTGLLHGAVAKVDNLIPQEIVYADTSSNLQSIPSSTAGFVLTSNGAAAPSFQAAGGFTGVLPIANGGTASTTATGSGETVLATSPTLITPTLFEPELGDAEASSLHSTGNIGCDAKIFATDLRVLGVSANQAVQTNGLKDIVTIANTGTGSNVLSASPTLTGTATVTNITSSGAIAALLGQFSNIQVTTNLVLQSATPYSTVAVNDLGTCQSIGPGTSGQVLTSNGGSSVPSYQQVSLAGVSGVLPVVNGGTGQTNLSSVTVGNASQSVSSTNVSGGSNGSLVVQTGVGTTGFIASGTNRQYLSIAGGIPQWTTPGPYFFVTTPKIITVSTTLTAAELCGMVIFQNGAAGNITLTMPTAASIIALMGTTTNTFVNTKLIQQTTQRVFTFVTNTGVTLDQGQINNTSGFTFHFLIQVTSPTTVYITLSST